MNACRTMTLCGMLCIAGTALGCSESGDPGAGSATSSSATSSSSSSGSGGLPPCMWDPTFGGVTVPDCTERLTAILQGTIDGMPYNETFTGEYSGGAVAMPSDFPPYRGNVFLPALGNIHAEWESPDVSAQFSPIESGYMVLPAETKMRMITAGSMVRFKCYESIMALILNVDGGQLAICARN